MRKLLLTLLLLATSALAQFPTAQPPATWSTDITPAQLTLLSNATAGNVCVPQSHVYCAHNTQGSGTANATNLQTLVGNAIAAIQNGSSVSGEVVVVDANTVGDAAHAYQFPSGGSPTSLTGGCFGNWTVGFSDGACDWLLGPLVQPNLNSITPLFIVSSHYGNFPDQHTRAIPIDGDGISSPAGQVHNVLPTDYATFGGPTASNPNPFLNISQNNTNGIRFIGIEGKIFSTYAPQPYTSGFAYGMIHTLGAGVTASRAVRIVDTPTGVVSILHGQLRIDVGYPTISEAHVVSSTPCSQTYNLKVPLGSATLLCLTGLNTHWAAGQSFVRFTFGGKDTPATDITVNSLPSGSGSGQCAAGATVAGNNVQGNLCVVDSTHAYLSVTMTAQSPANGGIHSFYVDTPPSFALTAAATASGGNTVYSGSFTTPANFGFGHSYTVTGFTTAANNGTFTVVSATATTITLNNAAGVAETHAATLSGNGTYEAGTEHSATDIAIQGAYPQVFTISCNDCPVPVTNGIVFIPTDAKVHVITATGTVGGGAATNWTSSDILIVGMQSGGNTMIKGCGQAGTAGGNAGCVAPTSNTLTQVLTVGAWIAHNGPSLWQSPTVTAGGFGFGSSAANETDVLYHGIQTNFDNNGTQKEAIEHCGPSRNMVLYLQRGSTYTIDCFGAGTSWSTAMNCSSSCGTTPISMGDQFTINSITVLSTTHLQFNVTVGAFADYGARNIIFDRVWVHGSDGNIFAAPNGSTVPCVGTFQSSPVPDCYVSGSLDTPQGIMIDGPFNAVINSYINAIHGLNNDSQAIGIQFPCAGPAKIMNNFASSSTENIFTGGGSGNTSFLGMCSSNDVEVVNNYIYKPPIWYNKGIGVTTGSVRTYTWSVKNQWETKGCNRCWIHANVMENNWIGAITTYNALTYTPRNANLQGTPAASINDVLIENNMMTGIIDSMAPTDYDVNMGYVPTLTTNTDPMAEAGSLAATQGRRSVIRNNLWIPNQNSTNNPQGIKNVGINNQVFLQDIGFSHNTILGASGTVLNSLTFVYGAIYNSVTPGGTCAAPLTATTLTNYWFLNNVLFMGHQANNGCTATQVAVNPTVSPNDFNHRFAGNVLPTPNNTAFGANNFIGTLSGYPTVNTIQGAGYPQLDQSKPFTIDYTLNGPLPTLAGWIGPNAANTTDAATAGVNMAPIQTMALAVMKGTAPTVVCTINQTNLPNAAVSEVYSTTLTTSNCGAGTWTVSSGTLPAGLSLGSTTGIISGTPTTSGTSNFTISFSTASQALQIVVNPALTITTTSMPTGEVSLSYAAPIVGTGGLGAYTWGISSGSMTVCPTLTTGLCISSVNGSITGTPTTATTLNFVVSLVDTGGGSTTQSLSITINPTVAITTASLPDGTQNVFYSQTVNGTGGQLPYTFTTQSGTLCTGLTQQTSGVINGTPTVVQTCSFTVLLTDNLGATATAPLSIIILAPANNPVITNTSFPNGFLNVPYSSLLTATGGVTPYFWNVIAGALPAGLSINNGGNFIGGPVPAQITGVPTALGTSNFTLRVTDAANNSSSQPFSITIQAPGTALIQGVTINGNVVIKP